MKIIIEMPEEIAEEYALSRGKEKAAIKDDLVEYIKKSIGSFRMRRAMEERREEMEKARRLAKEEVKW
jgi:hypothetical protein